MADRIQDSPLEVAAIARALLASPRPLIKRFGPQTEKKLRPAFVLAAAALDIARTLDDVWSKRDDRAPSSASNVEPHPEPRREEDQDAF